MDPKDGTLRVDVELSHQLVAKLRLEGVHNACSSKTSVSKGHNTTPDCLTSFLKLAVQARPQIVEGELILKARGFQAVLQNAQQHSNFQRQCDASIVAGVAISQAHCQMCDPPSWQPLDALWLGWVTRLTVIFRSPSPRLLAGRERSTLLKLLCSSEQQSVVVPEPGVVTNEKAWVRRAISSTTSDLMGRIR